MLAIIPANLFDALPAPLDTVMFSVFGSPSRFSAVCYWAARERISHPLLSLLHPKLRLNLAPGSREHACYTACISRTGGLLEIYVRPAEGNLHGT